MGASEQAALRRQRALELDAAGKGFKGLDYVRETAEPLVPLWGDWLFRHGITMVVGDPGIAKTTFGYALSMALCRGDRFLGKYADCEVRCLYLDFESVSRASFPRSCSNPIR